MVAIVNGKHKVTLPTKVLTATLEMAAEGGGLRVQMSGYSGKAQHSLVVFKGHTSPKPPPLEYVAIPHQGYPCFYGKTPKEAYSALMEYSGNKPFKTLKGKNGLVSLYKGYLGTVGNAKPVSWWAKAEKIAAAGNK